MGNGTTTTVETVEWGADFWQRVLISGLGTLGSLLVAVMLLFLTRWLTRRSDRKKEQEELAWRLVEKLAEMRVDVMSDPAILVNTPGPAPVIKIVFILNEYEYRLTDKNLKTMCDKRGRNMLNLWMKLDELSPAQIPAVIKRLSAELITMPVAFSEYLSEGKYEEIEIIDWATVSDDSENPPRPATGDET